MVVAARVVLGGGKLGEVRADRLLRAEIKRRAGHVRDLAGGDERGIHGRVAVGVERELVVEDGARALAAQVPVRVVRQVDAGGRVGGGLHVDRQLVLRGERVRDLRRACAGEALLTGRAHVGEGDRRIAVHHAGLAVPEALVEALRATVQAVGAVVAGDLARLAVDGELPLGNAVGAAAGGAPEVLRALDVRLERRAAEHHVHHLSLGVGHPELGDDGAVVGDLHGHARGVLQRPEVDGLAFERAPVGNLDAGCAQRRGGHHRHAHGEQRGDGGDGCERGDGGGEHGVPCVRGSMRWFRTSRAPCAWHGSGG